MSHARQRCGYLTVRTEIACPVRAGTCTRPVFPSHPARSIGEHQPAFIVQRHHSVADAPVAGERVRVAGVVASPGRPRSTCRQAWPPGPSPDCGIFLPLVPTCPALRHAPRRDPPAWLSPSWRTMPVECSPLRPLRGRTPSSCQASGGWRPLGAPMSCLLSGPYGSITRVEANGPNPPAPRPTL